MEYKALTFITLPFLDDGKGRTYSPGEMISHAEIEESIETGEAAIGEDSWEGQASLEDMIESMIEAGSLSEDPDAELHPAHRPVVPGAPTFSRIVDQAKALVAQYESEGEDVPEELRALADSRELVNSDDAGNAGESYA